MIAMEKKKKILLGIAGVALAAAVGYYFYDKKKKASTTPALAPSQEPVPIPISLPATSGNTGINYQPIAEQAPAPSSGGKPTIQYLASKTWKVWSNVYPGSTLNFRYDANGNILLGDGYKGKFVGDTIVTFERHGTKTGDTVWTPLNGVGVAGLRGLGSYYMNF